MEAISGVTLALAIETVIKGRAVIDEVERGGEIFWDQLLEVVSNARTVGCAEERDVKAIESKACDIRRVKEILACLQNKVPTNAPPRPRMRI